MSRNPSLFGELERVLHTKDRALACAISHGQVTIDGYTIKPSDDRRWRQRQLQGRVAAVNHRSAPLFGGSRRATVDAQSAHSSTSREN